MAKLNLNQVLSWVRTGLKVGGAYLAVHGHSKLGAWAGSEEALGIASMVVSAIWSHYVHADSGSDTANPSQKTDK